MRATSVLLAGVLALGGTVAACSGVAHLGALQFPKPNPPAQQTPAMTGPPGATSPGKVRLGVDLDVYVYKGMHVAADSRADIAYLQSLHANAVAITFPYFMSGPNSTTVYAGHYTPAPRQVATIAREAMAAGMHVSIRPLLSEYNLGIPRVHWKPVNLKAWFGSYRRFLKPYVRMAQRLHVPEFVTGVEFSEFGQSRNWARLDKALHAMYSGTLSYANNWGRKQIPAHITNAQGVVQTFDAYRPLPLAPNATQAQVSAAWRAYGLTLPRGIVISELGIASQPGAYRAPYRPVFTSKPFRPGIQAKWFTAACHAVISDHLGGIYFWAMNFGQSLTTPPSSQHPSAFVDGAGARAISSCFQWISGRAH